MISVLNEGGDGNVVVYDKAVLTGRAVPAETLQSARRRGHNYSLKFLCVLEYPFSFNIIIEKQSSHVHILMCASSVSSDFRH